jgi:hypothetical protein
MRQYYRNFDRIASGVAVDALRHQVIRNWKLWNQNDFRTEYPGTPHVDVDDIWLRFTAQENLNTMGSAIGDDKPVWYPAAEVLTEAKPLIKGLMTAVGAYELGRVLISRIPPGGRILAHRDSEGEYVLHDNIARYHVVLQGSPGSLYHCGEEGEQETVNMLTGEVWWFSAHKMHSVENASADDRIHLMVDVRTW